MQTRWVKFSGVIGAILTVVGVGAVTVLGPGVLAVVTFGHIFLGLALLALWFVVAGAKTFKRSGGVLAGTSLQFGAGTLIYSALFIALLVGVNYLGNNHNQRVDLTEAGVFSLAPQSRELVQNLDGKIKIVAFEAGGGQGSPLYDLLRLYKDANRTAFEFEIVDPRVKPNLIEKYAMKQGNLLYMEYTKRDDVGVSRLNSVAEEDVTNAIVKLTRGAAKKIYFVAGHGEPSIEDSSERGLNLLADAMRDEHLTVESLMLPTQEAIPADAAAVFLVAPERSLQPKELELLENYAANGGGLFLFGEPRGSQDVISLAQKFGITINQDIIVDTVQRLFAGPTIGIEPVANGYGYHPITKGLTSGQDISIFYSAASVKAESDSQDKSATYTELVKTGENSWAETNLSAIFDASEPTVALEDADTQGPVALGVAFEKEIENKDGIKKASKVVVFGDADWIRNDRLANFFNRDLALNGTNWLAGQEGGFSIRPRTLRSSAASMTEGDVKSLLAASFVVPELILLLGLMVWWSRKEIEVYPTQAQMS